MFSKRSGFGILIEYSGLNGSRFIFVLLLIYLSLLIIPMAGCAAERERSGATPKEQNPKKIVNSIKTQVGDLTLTVSGCVLRWIQGTTTILTTFLFLAIAGLLLRGVELLKSLKPYWGRLC